MKRLSLVTCVIGALTVCLFNPTAVFAKPGKAKVKGPHKIKKHSPPPFAPAHGYKHKHESGVELSFDSNTGAYLVTGKTGVYYHNGLFVTLSSGVWKVTTSLSGTWRAPKDDEVPVKLKTVKAKEKAKVSKSHGKKK